MPQENEMGGGVLNLEELEQRSKPTPETPAPTKLADIKLDASDVPDALRGKSLTDVLDQLERTRQALRMSEDARLALRNSAESGNERQPEPVAEPELTRDQIKELMAEDPLAAYEYMQQRMVRSLDDHLNVRLQPLVTGTVGAVEQQVRAKYADEFELFADQIEQAKKMVHPSVLATAKGWEDLVSYVRGQPGNFDVLVQRRTARPPADARRDQAENAGFTANRTTTRTTVQPTGGDAGLDETQKEIARELFPDKSPEQAYIEYKRWM